MEIYNKNLEYIRKSNYSLYEKILKSNASSIIEKVKDSLNLLVQNKYCKCFLHSIYDINRENREIFKNVNLESSLLIHFGIGFFHVMDYLKENFKKLNEIIIIEPNIAILKEIFEYIDLELIEKQYFKINILSSDIDEDESKLLSYKIQYYIKKGIDFSFNISYRTLYIEEYERIYRNIVETIKAIKVQYSTVNYFRDKWIDNVFSNLQHESIPVESFFNKFKENIAIMVSAGPSLNKDIEELKKLKGKVFIAAVGTAARILNKNGIKPDFCFALDANETEMKIFQDINTENSVLCYSNTLYKGIFKIYKGKKVRMITEGDNLTEYLYKKSHLEYSTVYSGYSVANTSLDVLNKMGFKKVILLGQDLCFSNGEYHAKGSFLPENFDTKAYFGNGYIKEKNIYNEDVYTIASFISMRKSFEDYLKKHKYVEVVNCTQGGLKIQGTTNKNLEDLINEMQLYNNNIQYVINEVFDSCNGTAYLEKLKNSITIMEKEIDELKKINDEKYNKIFKMKNDKMNLDMKIRKMENLDEFEDKMEKIDFYNDVAKKMLAPTITPIHLSFKYEGKDKCKLLNSLEDILILQYIEFDNFYNIIMDKLKNVM